MYPGTEKRPGLDIAFDNGTTLILGANGLGKTTLITMLYRLSAGLSELRSPEAAALSARSRSSVRPLNRTERRMFAARVANDAVGATAALSMRVGDHDVTSTRTLQTLDLVSLFVDGKEQEPSENVFRETITSASELADFGDWILLLRFVTFYFEDRRALVWDPVAQRQLLRLLYLPPKDSERWTQLEGEYLRLDSNMRNLRFSLNAAERDLVVKNAVVEASPDMRKELDELQTAQAVDVDAWETLSTQLARLESDQESARLNALRGDQERDAAYRDLERRQLLSIASMFPTRNETAEYLLSQLFADNQCLTCGHDAAATVRRMTGWLAEDRCVICGSPRDPSGDGASFTARAISTARTRLERAEARRTAMYEQRVAAEAAFRQAIEQSQRLRSAMAARSARIDSLVARLPPEAGEVHTAREELASLRSHLEGLRQRADTARKAYERFIRTMTRRIAAQAESVQRTFSTFAAGFLIEDCYLAYHPHKTQVGQSGAQISFPAFDLDMSGATFDTAVRRGSPEEVSESQREFIDLAFRMTLVTEAGSRAVGSLVIDAPESSLDAVFVTRAADVLTRFAVRQQHNRLIVTSNLVEGSLIPELIRESGIASARDHRVIDLLKVAEPTAAVRQLSAEYRAVRDGLFQRAARRNG